MNWIAFIFFVGLMTGPESQARGFDSLAECEKFKADLVQFVRTNNADVTEENKVVAYAITCEPVKPVEVQKGTSV